MIKKIYVFFNLLFNNICKKYIITYNIRPNDASCLNSSVNKDSDNLNTSIIIQGPVLDFDFLYLSCKLYVNNFPGSIIVVSTWKGEIGKGNINKLEDLNVKVIANEMPKYSGFKNFNLQLISTKKAIDYVRSVCDSEYILKTRTDQRIYSPNAILYLKNLLEHNSFDSSKIVACSLNTFKNRLYAISDMLLFADSKTMSHYWSAPMDFRDASVLSEKIDAATDFLEYSKVNICEQYLVTNYLASIEGGVCWSYESYERLLAKYFVVIDKHALDLVWIKYSYAEDLWKSYSNKDVLLEFSFNDWLIIRDAYLKNIYK